LVDDVGIVSLSTTACSLELDDRPEELKFEDLPAEPRFEDLPAEPALRAGGGKSLTFFSRSRRRVRAALEAVWLS
jgi:hypothetical protein